MFTNLYDYNRGKYNLSHADLFMQAINELYYASDQTKFMSASQLKASLNGTLNNLLTPAQSQVAQSQAAAQIAPTMAGTIDIGIINTTINQLNYNEKVPSTGGLTFANGKFVPIPGQTAFLSRKILLASPLQEMATGTAVSYKFSNALTYNNATTAIKNFSCLF